MKSVTALAFCGAMISCTHETDMGNSGNNLGVVETYEKAFISRFGEPSADADWGFGTANNAQARANTRAIQPSHDFSADAISKPSTTGMNSANFLEDVPANSGIEYYNNINYGNGFGGDQSCYIDSNTKQVNIYNNTANANLYVKGDCSSSLTSFYLGGSSNIYLLKNSKLTLDNGFQGNCKVYIAEGAVLTIKNAISTGNVSYYINGGTLDAKSSMVVNGGNEVFCEGGTFKVGGKFQIQAADFCSHNTTIQISGDIDVNHAWVNGTDRISVYYQEGGTFADTNDKLVCNSGKFYTSINTKFTYIEANGTGVIYNGANATMTSTGQIKLTNGSSIMINDGDLYGTYLGTEGSALFQNNGNTTISGETVVNSNQNTWVNNGHYTTNDFTYRALSDNVINNCHLKVNNLFSIKLGDTWPQDYESIKTKGFRMDANCGVETKDFEFMGPGFIHMGSNSVFKVTGTAYMGITKDIYGIYGPVSGDYAVFEAGSIVRGKDQNGTAIDANQCFVANYFKHLYVVTPSHFDFGWSNVDKSQWEGHVEQTGDQPYYRIADGAALYTGTEKPNINITPTNCNPGFNGGGGSGGGGGGGSTPDPIRVIAEDLNVDSNSDFDFNDVVFDVTWVSESKVKIKLLAAGGTLPLTVGWNGEGENWREYEVHYLLGYSDAAMINTHANVGMHYDDVAPYEFEFNGSFSKDNFAADVRDNIPVKVKRGGVWYPINADQGKAAGKLAVGTDYEPWCNEREDIDDWWQNNNLQGLFSKYTQNPTALTKYWYRSYTHRKGVAK